MKRYQSGLSWLTLRTNDEHGNGSSYPMKGREFIDQLNPKLSALSCSYGFAYKEFNVEI
jgi:hypothetical protein